MHVPRFRERQGFPYESPKPLAERIVEAFDVIGFARLFAHPFVLVVRQNGVIGGPEVVEAIGVAIGFRYGVPQAQARAHATVTQCEGQHLARATADR